MHRPCEGNSCRRGGGSLIVRAWIAALCILVAIVASCGKLESPQLPLTGSSSLGDAPGGSFGTGSAPTTPPAEGSGEQPPPPTPLPPQGGSFVDDPLTNGRSVGQVTGGRFVSSGWQVLNRSDFIRYVVPTLSNGFVEWDNLGLAPFNPQPDLYTLFGMWDSTKGGYRENPFRVDVRKLDTNGHNPPYVRMRFISSGEQHDVGFNFLDWDPNHAYSWRVEWGPTSLGNEARVFLDGQLVMRTAYGPRYEPQEHWIEMGVEERSESIVGIVYRNVRIGPR
ncbi:MAG TPA: hypothetical protein VLK65_31395 [Vicinamibacteria bacterium]|nr:hypothetical protein [Vicinamibacteria bacterium]